MSEEIRKEISQAELDIMQWLANGLIQKEIAGKRGTAYRTVAAQVGRLQEKVGVHTQSELVAYGFRNGLLK